MMDCEPPTAVLQRQRKRARSANRSKAESIGAIQARESYLRSKTLGLGLLGSLLLWAAFPPIDWPYLAWIAPVPWLWLASERSLSGRWSYVALWLAGCVHWLAMLYGIRLAHPALNAGWIALAAYLGVYLPLFVGLTRVAVLRLRWSLVVAAPVVWVGLELIRGHLITGFSMGLLAHTQAEFPQLIQVADLAGGYTLSFVLMLVAACLCEALRTLTRRASEGCCSPRWRVGLVLAVAASVIGATLGYGQWRLTQVAPGVSGPIAEVALIQGSLDTIFEVNEERIRETFDHYGRLTEQATRQRPNLDLVIWPESMFMVPARVIEEPLAPLPGSNRSADELREALSHGQEHFQSVLHNETRRANAHTASPHETLFLAGTTTFAYGPGRPRTYNTALLAGRKGNVVSRYYKMHAVMFGEYIPFGAWLPVLYDLTPLGGGLSTGGGPQPFEVAGLRFSPSICFESTVPHLIRGHVTELARRGQPCDVLVNVTNDGWFWGTAVLDQHFRCGVFRAVENRKPLVVAANTGFSTWVDGSGVVRARGPRRAPQVLIADVEADGRQSPYHTLGDWPATLAAVVCLGLAAFGWRRRQSANPE